MLATGDDVRLGGCDRRTCEMASVCLVVSCYIYSKLLKVVVEGNWEVPSIDAAPGIESELPH